MATYFTDAGTGNDTNDGLDNIGVGLATATWIESTLTLVQAGHGYTFATGDVIYISSGTGAAVDLYEVVSSTVNNIVLAATSSLPGVGDGDDFAAGDLATGDITSSDGPWITMDKGMNTVAAGDKVWVRKNGNYDETVTIDTVGTSTAPIWFEGYEDTLDDNVRAGIRGLGVRAACITDSLGTVDAYYIFENFSTVSATSHGIDLSSLSNLIFKNCTASSHGGRGYIFNDNVVLESCASSGNGSTGVEGNSGCVILGCNISADSSAGIQIEDGLVIHTKVFSSAIYAIHFDGTAGLPCVVYGGTIDGDSKDTNQGVRFPSGTPCIRVLANTIIYDCGTGATGFNMGSFFSSRNNLLYNNTTNYSGGFQTFIGEVTSDPLFVDEDAFDHTLSSQSPAKKAGFDRSSIGSDIPYMDIGAQQSPSGGGSSPNKRGNKQ